MGRLTRLDGLRGILAVYVMLGHTAPFILLPPLLDRIVEASVSHGLAAVNVFFALSGLVIVQTMARYEGRAAPFLAARARRLLPVYFVVLALATLALAWRSPFAVMPWTHPGDAEHLMWQPTMPAVWPVQLVLHLCLLQGITPRAIIPDLQFSLLGPAWSLSTEWQFYVAVALLVPLIGSDDRGLRNLVYICVGVALIGRVYAALAPVAWLFHRSFLPNEAAYFAIGVAAARLWRGPGHGGLFTATLAVAMLVGASHGSSLGMIIGKALPPLIWAGAIAVQRHPDHRWLRPLAYLLDHRFVLWLGAISYPLYLVNEPVGRVLAVLIGRATAGNKLEFSLLWGPFTVAGAIGIAALLHYTVERRFTRPPGRRAMPSAPAAPAASPSGPALG